MSLTSFNERPHRYLNIPLDIPYKQAFLNSCRFYFMVSTISTSQICTNFKLHPETKQQLQT